MTRLSQRKALRLFEGLSASYDAVLEYVTLFQDRYWKRFLLEKAELKDGLRVLDLACGTCVLEEYIVGRSCEVVGLDITEEMIRIGKEKRNPLVGSLVLGDAESIPFNDESFDVVLSCYLPKYCRGERLTSEIQRVLRPGGRVILYDFTRPRGFLGAFHALYVYGLLTILGFVASHTSKELEYTFTQLPKIIRESRWEERLGEALNQGGFERIEERVLSAGVVTAFWATKSPVFP